MTHITDIGAVIPGDPSAVAPKVADTVLYTLTASDALMINKRRGDFKSSTVRGMAADTGHVAHVGNHAAEGDVCAAEVVRVFANAGTAANLQVKLDGNDTYWATSRCEGDGAGFWSRPAHR